MSQDDAVGSSVGSALPDDPRPVLLVRSGAPTEDEVAALTVVVAAIAQATDPPAHQRPVAGGWRTYDRTLRRDHRPGPGAWRASSS